MSESIRLTVDLSQINQYLSDLNRGGQINFAISKALNDIGKAVQKGIQDDMKLHMNMRQPTFTLRAIKITSFAKANNHNVTIEIDPRAGWLTRLEIGQDHIPFGGKQYMGIPNKETFNNQIITTRNKLHISNLNLHKDSHGKTVGEQNTFIAQSSTSATPFIMQTISKGRGKNKKQNTRMLYTMVKKSKQPIGKINFMKIANQYINSNLDNIIKNALAYTLQPKKAKG